MTDLVGRIGRAHPNHPEHIPAYPPGSITDSPIPAAVALAQLRGQLRDLADDLDEVGHHGCAELVRAKVWEAGG